MLLLFAFFYVILLRTELYWLDNFAMPIEIDAWYSHLRRLFTLHLRFHLLRFISLFIYFL